MLLIGFLVLSGISGGLAAQMYSARLEGGQVLGPFGPEGNPGGVTPFSGTGSFVYDPGTGDGPTLSYRLDLPAMDLDGMRTPGDFSDDVTAIHIHLGGLGASGPHALNVFGFSGGQMRQDDGDLQVDSSSGVVTGLWDDGDALFTGSGGVRQPWDSIPLSDAAEDLLADGLYVQVHTISYPNGELRGQIQAVPEPAASILLGAAAPGLVWRPYAAPPRGMTHWGRWRRFCRGLWGTYFFPRC